MSKFLANIGAALRTPGLGDRLQAALAAAGGDTAALARLRALQLQRAEFQRQNDARDAQVIGAKNMGFSNDEIGAMGMQDLSLAARQRMTLGSEPSAADEGDGMTLNRNDAFQHAAEAINRGADPHAVRERLSQMGFDSDGIDTPSPFSDLVPDRRQVPQNDLVRFQSDSKVGGSSTQLSKQRLEIQQDRRIADQIARERGGDARDAETLYQGMRGLPVRLPTTRVPSNATAASSPIGSATQGVSRPIAGANPRVPPPAPFRPGGAMRPAEVDRLADLGMRMFKIHVARGMSPEQAAGWAANAMAEGRGNYRQPQVGGGPGWGLFQWGSNRPELDRRRTFQQVFGHPIQESTEEEQLAFRDWELAHTYASAARRIAQASSAGDAAAAITRYYEGPRDRVHPVIDRANIAEAILRRGLLMPNMTSPDTGPATGRQEGQGISARGSGLVRN